MVSLSPSESWECILNQHDVTANLAAGEAAAANGRIEFFLNRFPDAVGDIVEVTGNTSPMKMTNDFAIVNTNSDGQATATLVASRPGDTDVTAFAPGIQDRNTHKDFGVVHWVDGCPVFPGDAENRFGTPHPMSVTINNVSDGAPVQGTSVRWTIVDDDPNARFANASEDSNDIVTTTNASGEAAVTLEQIDTFIGDNSVFIEVLTPDGKTMFSHTMRKQWKQAVLDVEVTSVSGQIGLLAEVTFDITVTNTGNRDATGTQLVATLPAGMAYVSSTGDGTESNSVVTWDLGTIEIDGTASVQLTAQGVRVGEFEVNYRAESAEGLSDEETSSTEVLAGGLEVTKTGPAQVDIGGEATYAIRVSGTGTGASTGVRLVDTIPAGMSLVSSDPAGTQSGNQLAFELGALSPPATIDITVVLQANQAGDWTNEVRVTSTEGAEATAQAMTTVLQPELAITKEGPESGTALLSENFEYTITVTNNGNGVANNTTVVDTLPAGLEYVSSDPAGTVSEAGDTVTWSVGNMNPGASSTFTLTVLATTAGAQVNEASVTADNAAATVETETSTTVEVPAITIEKTGRTAIFVGNEVTYTLTATNNGEAPLTGVTISDTFATGMSYVSSSNGGVFDEDTNTVTWEIGDLAVDAQAEVTLTLQGDESGTMTNTASVTAAEQVSTETMPASVLEAVLEVSILPAPGATIAITDDFDPVREGENVTFTVTVSNQGRSPMTDVNVVVDIPAQFTIDSAAEVLAEGVTADPDAEPKATIDADAATVTYNHGEALATGDSFSFTITVTANDLAEGELRKDTVTTATLTYAEFSEPVSTDEGNTVIEQ
ncbi:MAG: DUF11 domain-containing protein [Chloroflexota bacterium]|nr:DUF11 domain-containing protein [Chloroflexota bacterium]MDE2941516.1 DUF11 domain-containing protein [Chloroflexota bacterium]MDE3267735.1 DUF11 domain-containing protein [Chloroflexota bacterium]